MFRVASLLALLVLSLLPASAQNPQPPALPPLPGQDTVQLQFGRSADVKDVLRLYEQLTGRRLVYDAEVAGPLPIVVKEKVSREEAVKIIERELLKNGFSLIPTESKTVWKVFGPAKTPRTPR